MGPPVRQGACEGRKQTECWGSMHGRSKSFVGIPRKERREKNRLF